MKDTARNDPRQDQEERKPDELDPARNLDLRRRAGRHREDRTARVVRLPTGPWDWALETDGSLALEPEPENWFVSVTPVRLKGVTTSATVAPVQPAPSHRRPPRRTSRSTRHASRRALLVAVGAAILVILAFAAFRPGGKPSVNPSAPASATRLLPPPPPTGLSIASYGRLHVASPINEDVVTAIGYHGAGERCAAARRPSAARRTPASSPASSTGSSAAAAAASSYYQLGGGEGPSTGALDVGASPGTDVYSPVDGTIVGLRDYVLNGTSVRLA